MNLHGKLLGRGSFESHRLFWDEFIGFLIGFDGARIRWYSHETTSVASVASENQCFRLKIDMELGQDIILKLLLIS